MNKTITQQDVVRFENHLLDEGKNSNTIQKYVRDITRFVQFLSDENRTLSAECVEEYIGMLKGKGYSLSSLNTVICCINTFCKFIGRYDIHCSNIKIRRKIVDESSYLTAGEYAGLIKTAMDLKDYRYAMLIQVVSNTDIRMNELCKLTVDALSKGEVSVIRAGEVYNILIPKQMLDDLYEYIKQKNITEGPIFCSANGKPLDRSNIFRKLKILAGKAGIDPSKVYPGNLKNKQAKKYYNVIYEDTV